MEKDVLSLMQRTDIKNLSKNDIISFASKLSELRQEVAKKTMIDTKKEQERDELHRAIWAIADDLRGAVDGWDFKNYVLGTMFYRYISENLTNYVNSGEHEAGNTAFDYAKMPDAEAEEARDGLVEEKGLPARQSFRF